MRFEVEQQERAPGARLRGGSGRAKRPPMAASVHEAEVQLEAGRPPPAVLEARAQRLEMDVCQAADVRPEAVRRLRWTASAIRDAANPAPRR